MAMGQAIQDVRKAAKEFRAVMNKPAFTMSPVYKAKRAKHEAARGVKAKMASKMAPEGGKSFNYDNYNRDKKAERQAAEGK